MGIQRLKLGIGLEWRLDQGQFVGAKQSQAPHRWMARAKYNLPAYLGAEFSACALTNVSAASPNRG